MRIEALAGKRVKAKMTERSSNVVLFFDICIGFLVRGAMFSVDCCNIITFERPVKWVIQFVHKLQFLVQLIKKKGRVLSYLFVFSFKKKTLFMHEEYFGDSRFDEVTVHSLIFFHFFSVQTCCSVMNLSSFASKRWNIWVKLRVLYNLSWVNILGYSWEWVGYKSNIWNHGD